MTTIHYCDRCEKQIEKQFEFKMEVNTMWADPNSTYPTGYSRLLQHTGFMCPECYEFWRTEFFKKRYGEKVIKGE